MSSKRTKNFRLNTLFLSCMSLVFGYTLWKGISNNKTITVAYTVPLSLYNTGETEFEYPEEVTVTLKGKRSALQTVTRNSAVHIDATTLSEKATQLALSDKHLFLPHDVKMVDCSPRIITITTHHT